MTALLWLALEVLPKTIALSLFALESFPRTTADLLPAAIEEFPPMMIELVAFALMVELIP